MKNRPPNTESDRLIIDVTKHFVPTEHIGSCDGTIEVSAAMAQKRATAKVLVIGNQGVGKTSLVNRYVTKMFDHHVTSTIGVSHFQITQEIGDHDVTLQIWDTAGQERFRSLMPMYYRNSAAALLVYDVTSKDSFVALKEWASELQNNVEENIILFVVGNKTDVPVVERQVEKQEANDFADSVGAHFREVSALSSHGVNDVFLDLCIKVVHMQQLLHQKEEAQASIGPSMTQESNQCCGT